MRAPKRGAYTMVEDLKSRRKQTNPNIRNNASTRATKKSHPGCPVVPLFPFLGKGSPLDSTNQNWMPFFPMATEHLSHRMSDLHG